MQNTIDKKVVTGQLSAGVVENPKILTCPRQLKDFLKSSDFVWTKNSIQIDMADILGLLLSGDTSYEIYGMYAEFGSGANPTVTSDARSYFHSTIPVTRDIIRVPLLITPSTSSSSSGVYTSNQLDFIALVPASGTGLVNGTSLTTGSTVRGGGLISVPGGAYTNDKVATWGYLSSSIDVPASPSQVMLRWQLTFQI